jgi:hypothetical protein
MSKTPPSAFECVLGILGAIVFIALVVALCGAYSGFVAMLLWNAVVVPLFHAHPIGFWLGVGLSLLLSFVGGAFRCAASPKA